MFSTAIFNYTSFTEKQWWIVSIAEYSIRGQRCSIATVYIAPPPPPLHMPCGEVSMHHVLNFFPPPDIPNKATFHFFSAMPYLQKQMLIFHAQVQLLITASVVLKQTCELAAKL